MRAFAAICLGCLIASTGPACKGKKRELGLSRARDGAPPVIVVDGPVRASGVGRTAPEVEPNDQRDNAGVVSVPGGIDGSLLGPEDIDFYRVEAGPARILVMEATGKGVDEGGADLILDVYDEDGNSVARSDRGPAGVLEGVPNWAVPEGKPLFISISEFVKKAKRGKDKAPAGEPVPRSYRLTVQTIEPGPAEEIEPNDDAAGAREVLLADEVMGYLGWSKDVDLWKLSLAGFSAAFALDVEVEGTEGVALTLELLAQDGSVIATRKGQKDRGLRMRGFVPAPGTAHWLARLSGSRSNPTQPYRLVTRSRSLEEGDEVEPNDDREHAIVLGPAGDGSEGEARGFLGAGDVDVYKIEAGREPMTVDLVLDGPGGVDVKLRALDASGAERMVSAAGTAGQREELRRVPLAPGAVVFVEVSGQAVGDEVDPYRLRWTTTVDLGQPMPGAGSSPPGGSGDDDDPALNNPYDD